jgi:hypothetical protein
MVALIALALLLLVQVARDSGPAESRDAGLPVDRALADLLKANGMHVPEAVHPISDDDIWQTAPYCGANCLYALLVLNDRPVRYSDLRKEVPTASNGASLLDLQRCAERFGLATEVLSVNPGDFRNLRLPIIALLGEPVNGSVNGHYVAVCSQSDDEIAAIDGTTGNVDRIGRPQFNRAFSGYVLAPKRNTLAFAGARYTGSDVALILGCVLNLFAIGALLAGRSSRPRQQ